MRVLLKSDGEPNISTKRKLDSCTIPSDARQEQINIFKRRLQSEDIKGNPDNAEIGTRRAIDGRDANTILQVNENSCKKKYETPQDSKVLTKSSETFLNDAHADATDNACPGTERVAAAADRSSERSNYLGSNSLTPNKERPIQGDTNKETRDEKKIQDRLEGNRDTCIVPCPGKNKLINQSTMDAYALTATHLNPTDHTKLNNADKRNYNSAVSNSDGRESGKYEQRPGLALHDDRWEKSVMEGQLQPETLAPWGNASFEQTLSQAHSFPESFKRNDAQDILAAACSAVGIDDELDGLMNSIDSTKQPATHSSTSQNQTLSTTEASPKDHASGKTVVSNAHQTGNMNQLAIYPLPSNAKPSPRLTDLENGYPPYSGTIEHRQMPPRMSHPMPAVQVPVPNKVQEGNQMIPTDCNRMRPQNWPHQQQQQQYSPHQHYYNQQQHMYQKQLYHPEQLQAPHPHPQYYRPLHHLNQQQLQYAQRMHYQMQQRRLAFPDHVLKENSKEQEQVHLRERRNVLPHPMYSQGGTSRTILYRGPHPYEGTALPNVSQDARETVCGKSNPVPDIKHAEHEPRNHPNLSSELQYQHSIFNETANRNKHKTIHQTHQIPQSDPRRHPQRNVERNGMEIVQPPVPLQSVKASRKVNDVGLPQSRSDSVNVICTSPNVIKRILNPAHDSISNGAPYVPNHPPNRSNKVYSEPCREFPKSHLYCTPVQHSSSFDNVPNQVKSTVCNSEILTDTITSSAPQTRTICVPPVDVLRFHRQEMSMPHHFIRYPQRSPQDHVQNYPKLQNFKNFTGNPPRPSVPSSMSSSVNSSYYNQEVRLRALNYQPLREHLPNQQNTNTEQFNNHHKHSSNSTVVQSTVQPEFSSYHQWADFRGRSNPYPTPEMQYPGYIVRDPAIERHTIPRHLSTVVIDSPTGVRVRPEMVSKQPTSQAPHMHPSAETNFRQQNPTYQRQFQDDSHLQHINYSHPNQLQHPPNKVNVETNIRPPLQNHLPVQSSNPEFYPRAPLHAKHYMQRNQLASPTQTLRNLPQWTHPRPPYSQYSDRLQSTDRPIVPEDDVSRSLDSGQISSIRRHQEDPKIIMNRENNFREPPNYILAERTLPVHYDNNQPLGLQRVGQCIAEAHSILLADSTHEISEKTWRSEEWQKANSVVNHHGTSLPIRSQVHSPDRSTTMSLERFNSELTGNSRMSSSETPASDARFFKNSENIPIVRYHIMESSKQASDSRSTRKNNPMDRPRVDTAQPANHPLPGSLDGNPNHGSVTTSRTPVAQVRGEGSMSSFQRDRMATENKYPYQVAVSHQNQQVKPTLHAGAEDTIDSNKDSTIARRTTSSEERIIKAMRNPYVLVTDIMKSKKFNRKRNSVPKNSVHFQNSLSSTPDQVQQSEDISHRSEESKEHNGRETSDAADARSDRRETAPLKRRSRDGMSNFRKVRRLSIDDNKQLENPSEEDSNDELPDIEKRDQGSVALIQGCPTDELPSCSYFSKHSNTAMPIRKRICKEDELFASSARADTPPSPVDSSSYAPEWERTACCSLTEIQKAETTHFHDVTVDDTNPESVEKSSIEDPASNSPEKSDKDTKAESDEHDRDISDCRPRSPVEDNDVQTRSDATESMEISPREIFLEQLQPVLNTLLSAPEAGSLRYLLHDPGRLLEEMVYTWGGKPSAEENYLTKMKQNFEIFLKLFVSPDKCSEWGWEGRSVEDILKLLNSDQGEVDESNARPVEETELRATPPQQEAMEASQLEPEAAGTLSRRSPASPGHTDTLLVTSSIAASPADEQGTLEHTVREEPSPDSNCLDSSMGMSPVVISNLADSTITTSETSCSPTSSDQTVGASSRCCCGHWYCNKSSGLKCPRNNEDTVVNRIDSNGKKKPSKIKIVRSGDTLLNSEDSHECNDEPTQPNAIIKSFATSTTDIFSSAHLESISDRSVSTEPSDSCYESRWTTFPTLDASPSENC